MIGRLLHKFSMRKCTDEECLAQEFHTHHLTWIGKLYYGIPWRDVRIIR